MLRRALRRASTAQTARPSAAAAIAPASCSEGGAPEAQIARTSATAAVAPVARNEAPTAQAARQSATAAILPRAHSEAPVAARLAARRLAAVVPVARSEAPTVQAARPSTTAAVAPRAHSEASAAARPLAAVAPSARSWLLISTDGIGGHGSSSLPASRSELEMIGERARTPPLGRVSGVRGEDTIKTT